MFPAVFACLAVGLKFCTASSPFSPSPRFSICDCWTCRLIEAGIALNNDGDLIKVSPDGRLKQSSSYSDSIQFKFVDGQQLQVPGSYIEFVERVVLPQYESVPRSQRTEQQYRDGFEAANATHIFTSTNNVQ